MSADKLRAEAASVLERHRKAMASVDAALTATRAAETLLPGDPALSEAAAKLEAKCKELQSRLRGLNVRVETALSERQKAGEAVTAAGEGLAAAVNEQKRRTAAVGAAEARVTAAEARGRARSARSSPRRPMTWRRPWAIASRWRRSSR